MFPTAKVDCFVWGKMRPLDCDKTPHKHACFIQGMLCYCNCYRCPFYADFCACHKSAREPLVSLHWPHWVMRGSSPTSAHCPQRKKCKRCRHTRPGPFSRSGECSLRFAGESHNSPRILCLLCPAHARLSQWLLEHSVFHFETCPTFK